VDKGVGGGHLAVCPLDGNGNGLLGGFQEHPVKLHNGDKFRVQLGKVLNRNLNSVTNHLQILLYLDGIQLLGSIEPYLMLS
jgi:hypothetical protein